MHVIKSVCLHELFLYMYAYFTYLEIPGLETEVDGLA